MNPFFLWPEARCRVGRYRWLPLLVVLLIAACSNRADLPAEAPDVTFRTIDGATLTLREATGPVLVNFWSTSCVVCLREMPDMAGLHEDFAPRGFELIAVAMPYDRPDVVLELASEHNLPFPVAIDIDGIVLAAFEPVAGTPTSFLIGADGKIVSKHVGAIDMEALRLTLDELLADSAAI